MCEIAVYDPEELSVDDAFDVSFDMFKTNNDGLGALAVYKGDDSFSYQAFAQADPSWSEFLTFLMEQRSEGAWRIILHARLSTTGANSDTNTHPLEVGEGSDFEWVIHNGVVTNHMNIKRAAEGAGHEYATDVDSESIAHCVEELPESVGDIDTDREYRLAGRLNYILCNEDGIFVHNTGKYEWTEDFTMTKCRRDLSFDDATDSIKWMILKPDDTVETVESDRTTTAVYSRRGSYWGGAGGNTRQSRFHSEKPSGRSSRTTSKAKPESESDLPEDLGALFNDEGELIAWWEEDEMEKYTTDYDEYKDSYGEGNDNEVVVYGDELGSTHGPDSRVPDEATGMYIVDDGTRIEWWSMGEVGDEVDHGTVNVDEVVLETTIENGEIPMNFLDGEGDSGNSNGRKTKSGKESSSVNGVTYSDEAVSMWQGHFGPEPQSAD